MPKSLSKESIEIMEWIMEQEFFWSEDIYARFSFYNSGIIAKSLRFFTKRGDIQCIDKRKGHNQYAVIKNIL